MDSTKSLWTTTKSLDQRKSYLDLRQSDLLCMIEDHSICKHNGHEHIEEKARVKKMEADVATTILEKKHSHNICHSNVTNTATFKVKFRQYHFEQKL